MARGKQANTDTQVADYRYAATRKNNPPAGLAAQGVMEGPPKVVYAYNPHLPPCLRFDDTGRADKLSELLAIAKQRPLADAEVQILADALRHHEPWLEWAGKQESKGFAVDPVALHIHERISAQAILRVAAREDTADMLPGLFANPQLEYHKAVQFYQHDVDWSNRMILGDSLQVMTSLARREDLAGKVQMIYMDPPYGIRFGSNFQPEVGQRDVKDREQDLTREPEMVKAYRDTWTLGVHSYLAYLRDRLCLCKELLADSGSVFIQISDENLHRVRALLDEVFGSENFLSQISFATTTGFTTHYLANVADHVLWYAKDPAKTKFRRLFREKVPGEEGATKVRPLKDVAPELSLAFDDTTLGVSDQLTSQGATSTEQRFEMEGKVYSPTLGLHWKTTVEGLNRLRNAGRLKVEGKLPRYLRMLQDFNVFPISNIWLDIGGVQNRTEGKLFVVQTATAVIERCMLMTTDPGDLVLDPTCGSGTTAYVAEQWGRRWITIDTTRVALAIARQRLLTSRFDYYKLRNDKEGIEAGLVYKTVPHITLKSIAQNQALDPIFEKYQLILDEKLVKLNAALAKVDDTIRTKLATKLTMKQKQEGKRAITEADQRRWLLPKQAWKEWEVPFDADPNWPDGLKKALEDYRMAWRAKMDEVNACIAANAEQEELVDQPEIERSIVRVSGPFTMEGVMPVETSLTEASAIGGAPEELDSFDVADNGASDNAGAAVNAEAYLEKMLRLLKNDGVRFPNNKVMAFGTLDLYGGEFLHAEGEWSGEEGCVPAPSADAVVEKDDSRLVAVSFGPEHGPVTAYQVENALRQANRRGVDDLVFAGFSFDATAQAIIQEDANPHVHVHLAHIAPDVAMGDLLKDTPSSQLFTVFGSPRTRLEKLQDGQFRVTMEGVDIYDPVSNTIHPTGAGKVAAWFLDADYDGQTFCITQAFFPDKSAWDRLARALKGTIDEEAFAAFSGTVSLPFSPGKHKRCAVKVIDPRGNEVMSSHRLDSQY